MYNALPSAGSDLASRNLLDEQISLFAIGTVLVRSWRRIVRWALIGGAIALAAVITKPKLFPASLAFVPQGGDAARSGLASLAGQFGISAPTGNPVQQPDFFLALLQSREILAPVVLDTFVVQEDGQSGVAFYDLFRIDGSSPANRLENGLKKLRSRVHPSVVKSAGIVRVVVRTEWPSVSLQISQSLLEGVNAYNLRTRQSQAAAERKFVEGRLNDAKDSLRAAEDRLQEFLAGNRAGINGFINSPHLNSAYQRYEREVGARMTIVTSLTQEYEETRIREVRDTPTITVFESPSVATTPDPRRRVITVLVGMLVGAGIGAVLALVFAAVSRRRSLRDPEADEFFGVLSDSKNALLRRLPVPRQGQT